MNKKEIFDREFLRPIIKIGSITNALAILVSLAPVAFLAFVEKAWPGWSVVIQAVFLAWSTSGAFFIVEPVSYFPILGIPGTYMAFLAGDIANCRLPCAAAAQRAVDVERGTPEAELAATLGISGSMLTSLIFNSLAAFGGVALVSKLPVSVTNSFKYVLPAVFGAVFAQFAMDDPKLAGIALVIGLLMSSFTSIPTYVIIPVCIFGTIFVARALHKKDAGKAKN